MVGLVFAGMKTFLGEMHWRIDSVSLCVSQDFFGVRLSLVGYGSFNARRCSLELVFQSTLELFGMPTGTARDTGHKLASIVFGTAKSKLIPEEVCTTQKAILESDMLIIPQTC